MRMLRLMLRGKAVVGEEDFWRGDAAECVKCCLMGRQVI